MTVIDRIAEAVGDVQYARLPSSIQQVVRRSLLDTLIVGIAGNDAEGVPALRSMARFEGSAPHSSVWGTNEQLSAGLAAIVNGVAASALELDTLNGNVHSDAVVLPAALAVAERTDASGADFLAGYVAGVELVGRMGEVAVEGQKGWSFTSIYGVFGAAAAAARIANASDTAVRDALGLGLATAAGSQQPNAERVLAKRLQPGLAARNGVFAADAAMAGISAPRQAIEGKAGLNALYHEIQQERLLKDWGTRFAIANTAIKKYPVCACSHAAIEACIALRARHHIDPSLVRRVDVRLTPFSYGMVGAAFDPRGNPQVMGQYSVQYAIACVLLHGGMTLADLDPAKVRDPTVTNIVHRVAVHADPNAKGDLIPATVIITTMDGATFEQTITALPGSPEAPISDE